MREMPGPAGATRKRRDRPLLIVHTGRGKGKSTAAFGLMLRAWARGYRIGVYQFVKSGKWRVGEHRAALALGGLVAIEAWGIAQFFPAGSSSQRFAWGALAVARRSGVC